MRRRKHETSKQQLLIAIQRCSYLGDSCTDHCKYIARTVVKTRGHQ